MELTVRKFVADFRMEIERQIIEDSLRLSKGTAADFAAYKHAAGVRVGMEKAAALAREMLKRVDDLDDRAEADLGELRPIRYDNIVLREGNL